MTVSTMQLDEQEKTLTLAVKLQQGLALAKLLDIMNSEQKTIQDWPDIPTRATRIKGRQNCCYGTEYQSVDPCCEGLTTVMLATYVNHQYARYTTTN
jgi:hypothetical protein